MRLAAHRIPDSIRLPRQRRTACKQAERIQIALDRQSTGQQFRNGYFDQAAQLWSESGALLATSNQIVYFKE